MNILETIEELSNQGYDRIHAEARLCQDIVIQALAKSSVSRNVTIKGGVVMRSISNDTRRATRDLDIDFIKYSLEDNSINRFIEKINCLDGINIVRTGNIEELRQQDYHGKRVHIRVEDEYGHFVNSKIDLGVHNNFAIEQEEYCFDICFSEEGASLLVNSKEQMITEKLCSLLKFGTFSTRYKDIFDIYFLCSLVDKEKLRICIQQYILTNPNMKEKTMQDVFKRVNKTFSNVEYRRKLALADVNWLDVDVDEALDLIETFLEDFVEKVS